MFHVVESHFEVIPCFLTNQKFDDFQVDKALIQVGEWYLKVSFCLLTRPKFNYGEVEKAMFQVVARHWENILFLLTSPKCESRKRYFKGSNVTLNSFTGS